MKFYADLPKKWYFVALATSTFCIVGNALLVAPSLKQQNLPSFDNDRVLCKNNIICFSTSEYNQVDTRELADFLEDDEEVDDSSYNHMPEITEEDVKKLSVTDIKTKLLGLLPKMVGTPEELRLVEIYVNTLEAKYTPVQTLDFLNLAMSGDWQLLFSTNRLGRPVSNFRLREMYQTVSTVGLEGNITNIAQWDLAQQEEDEDDEPYDPTGSGIAQQQSLPTMTFDASGTFEVVCSYKINQGARMILEMQPPNLRLAKGSSLPKDLDSLLNMIFRSMPKELWDLEKEHAIDTTYLDGDLRIIRMAGPAHEAVRDIFIRRGGLQINPTGASTSS